MVHISKYLNLTIKPAMSITLTKGAFSRSPLLCHNIPQCIPIIYWETGGKEVENGRKRLEVVAFSGIRYDAVGSSKKRYNAVHNRNSFNIFTA